MKENLRVLPNDKIDLLKWDKCIAENKAHIYCRKEYLDTMAINWLGFIYNDYEAVMPICIRKKGGIKYAYTPAFIQQLGLIAKKESDHFNSIFELVKKEIFSVINYGDINLNYKNSFTRDFCSLQTNFIIDLRNSYPHIYNNYKSDLKQNLKKAAKENFTYAQCDNVDVAIEQYQKSYGKRMSAVSKLDFKNFNKLCLSLQTTNNCIVRKVVNFHGEILSIALLLIDDFRIYNIANTNTALGRSTEANHFLIDSIIKEFAERELIFDFEGSDLPGVKQFYQKFGAINEPYYHWHFNHLSWWFKLFKK